MASSDMESESEYEYSDDEDYPVEDYDEMDWNADVGDNPNAAPMLSTKGQ